MSEQTPSETDTETQSAEAETEVDLDSLLQDYETETKPEKTEEQPNIVEINNFIREQTAERTERDIKSAMETVKNNMEIKLPDRLIRGALLVQAEDPRFIKAWENRKTNPGQYEKILKSIAKEISNDLPDFQATETHNEVVSAVKGASQKKSTEGELPDFNKMSDNEFNIWKSRGLR